jgi:BolA family transcriptional regulator, general stress-responsive regulator
MHSRGQETHYKAVIVSEQFAGLNAVKRHQRAYAAMGDLMQQIHALALHTYTPEEWAEQGVAPASPVCAGGHISSQAAWRLDGLSRFVARMRAAPAHAGVVVFAFPVRPLRG